MLSACTAALFAGCSSPGVPNEPPRTAGTTLPVTVRADWDDLNAAVARAAPKAAAAVLAAGPPADPVPGAERSFRILTIDEQQATVTATLRAPWSRQSGPVLIEITATVGTPNDTPRAAALAGVVAEELKKLAGRLISPE